MVFNSIFFIFCFLPVFMLLYYLIPGRLRNLLLFFGSLIFYAWGEPVYVILMLFSSIFNYYMGTELERLYYDDRLNIMDSCLTPSEESPASIFLTRNFHCP